MFSKSHGYAIRALVMLCEGYNDVDKKYLASDIAEKTGISPSFLSKILQQLTSAGLLDSTRGRHGGVRLKQDPKKITLFDVAVITDDFSANPDAPPGFEDSLPELKEAISQHWQPYHNAIVEYLIHTSIADLAREVNLAGARKK